MNKNAMIEQTGQSIELEIERVNCQQLSELDQQINALNTEDLSLRFDEELSHLKNCVSELTEVNTSKNIVVFSGISGVGKSSQIESLSRHLQAEVFHMGKFAKQYDMTAEQRRLVEEQRARGELIQGLDEPFLDSIADSASDNIILDGFPRSPEEAVNLYSRAVSEGWSIRIVNLHFDISRQASDSFARQTSRYIYTHNKLPDDMLVARHIGKIERAVSSDIPTAMLIKLAGAEVNDVAVGSKSKGQVSDEIYEYLNLNSKDLNWNREILAMLSETTAELGIDSAYVTCGGFYRPFWNDRFGTPQESFDVDICVSTESEAVILRKALRSKYPEIRWSAYGWDTIAEFEYGFSANSFVDAMSLNPIVWRQGGVKLQDGIPQIVSTEECLADLRSGVLRLDESILSSFNPDQQERLIEEAVFRAHKAVSQYPALKIQGLLADRYAERYGEYQSKSYQRNHKLIKKKVEQQEGTHGRSRWNGGLLGSEISSAELIVEFYESTHPVASAIPVPPKVRLPGVLGELQALKEVKSDSYYENLAKGPDEIPDYSILNQNITPPVEYESWLHYMAYEATDEQFSEWIINQVRSRQPLGGADPFVKGVMDYSVFRKFLPKNSSYSGDQKVTHQGAKLRDHLLWATVSIGTKQIVDSLKSSGYEESLCQNIQAGLRLGMLCHDIGKLWGAAGCNTPGVHQSAGAYLWDKVKPEWLPDEAANVARWCIENHDLLGRLCRGVMEKIDSNSSDVNAEPSYKGAINPSDIRLQLSLLPVDFENALNICTAVYTADVSSVPTLRWHLPTAPLAADAVRAGYYN